MASYLKSYLQNETGCRKLRLHLLSGKSLSSFVFGDGFEARKTLFKIRVRFCEQSPGKSFKEEIPLFRITECSCKSNSTKDRKLQCDLTDESPKIVAELSSFFVVVVLLSLFFFLQNQSS